MQKNKQKTRKQTTTERGEQFESSARNHNNNGGGQSVAMGGSGGTMMEMNDLSTNGDFQIQKKNVGRNTQKITSRNICLDIWIRVCDACGRMSGGLARCGRCDWW